MDKIKITFERISQDNELKTRYEHLEIEGNIFELEYPLKHGLLSLGFNEDLVNTLFGQYNENDDN